MLKKLLRKVRFFLILTQKGRTKYIYKHKELFHHVGKNLMWQSRYFPDEPELISLGDNNLISSNVTFITHDMIHQLLNTKYNTHDYKFFKGKIELGNNVLIGSGAYILPNVKIGNDCIIGAGAIITKDIPSDTVGGVPFRKFNNFTDLVEKRKDVIFYSDINKYWD